MQLGSIRAKKGRLRKAAGEASESEDRIETDINELRAWAVSLGHAEGTQAFGRVLGQACDTTLAYEEAGAHTRMRRMLSLLTMRGEASRVDARGLGLAV